MTDSTKQAIEQFALQIIDATKTGAAWTAEQTPLLVQEWLRWILYEHIFWAIVITVISLVMLGWARYCHNRFVARPNSEFDDGRNFLIIGATAFFVIAWAVNGYMIVKVLVAPRVVVFEKFMELVR